jgi:hypothetical protein
MRIRILGSGLMGGNSERSSPELDMNPCSATRGATTNSSGWRAMLKARSAPAWRCHD